MNTAIPVDDLSIGFAGADRALAAVAGVVSSVPESQRLEALHDQMTGLHEYVAVGLLAPMKAAQRILQVAQQHEIDPAGANSIADQLIQAGNSGKVAKGNGTRPTPPIFAAPYAWRDPATIPPREWLYGRHYIRGFVTATVAPGGMGKSSLAFAEAVAMCTGRDLLGHPVQQKFRVWVWNGEDPAVELERRVAAICLHFSIDHHELANRLFVNSGRDMPIRLAEMVKGEVRLNHPQIEAIISECKARKIDAMILDPWVSTHGLPESANTEIDRVIKGGLAVIAERANVAIDVVHHVRKAAQGQTEFTMEDARGAGSLRDAVRSARVLNVLTPQQATGANVTEENRRLHFRSDSGKTSMVPPTDSSKWYRLVSVPLGNATKNRPEDHVGVVTPWALPDAFADIQVDDLRKVQTEIGNGQWAANIQASSWAGHAIGKVLGIDTSNDAASKSKAKQLLAAWLKSGALKTEMVRDDAKGRDKPVVVVGERI